MRQIHVFLLCTALALSPAAAIAQAQDGSGIAISEPPPVAGSNAPAPLSMQQELPGTASGSQVLRLPAGGYVPSVPAPEDNTAPEQTDTTAIPDAAQDHTEVPLPPEPDPSLPEPNTIVLQGLNKVTGHISRLEAPVGTVMRFGNLEIIGRRCWKSPPDEQPENAGLLEIWELKPGESHQRIFLGWIFSSSPGLSGLQHPVYDVTMLECLTLNDPEQGSDTDKKEDEKGQ